MTQMNRNMESVSSLATNDSPVLDSACGIYQPLLSQLLPLFSLLQFPKTIFKVYLTKKVCYIYVCKLLSPRDGKLFGFKIAKKNSKLYKILIFSGK